MKPRPFFLLRTALLSVSLLSLPASAVNYYWDNNGATAGFGTAAGTWAEPTTGDATQGFSTDIAGTTLPVDVTTTGSDIALFGTDTVGLGTGTVTVSGSVSAQRVDFRAASGAITLTGGTINLTTDVVSRATGMTINSDIAISGAAKFIKARNVAMTTTLGGVISGNGDVTFTNSGTLNNPDHAYVLNGNSTYTGDTLFDGGGNTNSRLRVGLGVNDALPVTTVLTIDGRNGTGSGRDTRLDLNGYNQTIAGLTNVVRNSTRRQKVRGPGTLTINNSGNYTFSGYLTGALNLEKTGSGTQTLSGGILNDYTGTTTISNGSLRIGNLAALGSTSEIILGDGASLIPALDGLTVTAPITLGGVGTNATINAPTSATGAVVHTLTLNGAISGDGDLTFNGSAGNNSYGTIVLGAASNYSGTTLLDTTAVGATCWVENGITNALPATTVLTLDGGSGTGSGRVVQYDLAGFDQTLAGLQSVRRIARNQFVTSDGVPATLTLNADDDYSFGDVYNYTYLGDPKTTRSQIRGQLSLVKTGAGTFTLRENHTYTGSTTITGGTLQGEVGGSIASSAVTLDSLGTYGVLVTDSNASWTCDSLTTTGAGTLQFNFGSVFPSASVSPMIITNAADFSAATPLVSVLVDAGLPPGTYPLATWDSLVGSAPTGAQVTVSTLAPFTGADLSVTGNTLNLVIVSTAVDVAKGDNINDLNLGTSWSGGTAPGGGDTAVWNNTVSGANTTALGADLSWGSISILDPGGPVTINAGNTLTLTGDTFGNLTLLDLSAATADLTINADLVMADVGLWDVAAGRTLTVAGAISGTFGPIKQGDGTAVISGANTYTGETSVDAGTLRLGAADVIPDGGSASNVTVDGTLDLNGFSETVNGLSGSGVIDTVSGGSPVLTVGNNGQSTTFDGIIQNTAGTLGLTKIGVGTLTLGGANTLSGPIDVQNGRLAFTDTNPFDNASSLTLGDNAVLRANVVNAVIGMPITLGGAGTFATINPPTVSGGASPPTPLPLTLNGPITGDGNLDLINVQGDNQYARIVLNAASTYTGDTLISCSQTNSQMFVFLGTENALPTSTVVTIDGNNGAGSGRNCDLNLNGNNQTLAGLTNVARASSRRQRVNNTSGTLAILTINSTADSSFGGRLGDGGTNLGLTKDGSATFTLSGLIRYAGDTTVNAGILSLGEANPNNDASTVTIADTGATLDLDFVGTDTVDQLFVGTTQLAAGEYKAVGSAASGTELAQLTGTGTLTVTTGPAGYATWAATNAGGQGPELDFDGDGVENGVEYVVGGLSTTNDLDKLPTVATPGGGMTFTFVRDQASVDGTTSVVIEVGTDLGSWPTVFTVGADTGSSTAGVTVVDNTDGTDTVTLTVARDTPKKFARLKVTVP